jgi:predicted ribosome-associated RNA-binding protein Tma20
MKAMRATEDAFAPGIQEFTFAVKHGDRMCAAAENKDTVLAINGDRCDFLETPTLW